MDTLTVTLQYLNPSNQHDVHLRFIQCYMSDIFQFKKILFISNILRVKRQAIHWEKIPAVHETYRIMRMWGPSHEQ